MPLPQAEIDWRDGRVPVSTRFDDPYYSLDDGLAETQYVFLGGNDLPARFRDGFHIAELGFGTGLNFLASLAAWQDSETPGRLHFTSFEAFPMTPADMTRALAGFPSLSLLGDLLIRHWPDAVQGTPVRIGPAELRLITGDARDTLPDWPGQADAWFLDGFSPAKNPELWQASLMADVARHTCPGGTAATYTAAGFVRRALSAAGFDVARIPGFGRKRHMTTARRPA